MKRIINAFLYSLAGLKAVFQSEIAFRQELLLTVFLLLCTLLLHVDAVNKVLLISSVLFILIAELINTAIETIINRISEARHPLSKKAKDIGSAIVLIAFFNAICTWAIILITYFIK